MSTDQVFEFEIADDVPNAREHRQLGDWLEEIYAGTDWSAKARDVHWYYVGLHDRKDFGYPRIPEILVELAALDHPHQVRMLHALLHRLRWTRETFDHPHLQGPDFRRLHEQGELMVEMIKSLLAAKPPLKEADVLGLVRFAGAPRRQDLWEVILRTFERHVAGRSANADLREAAAKFYTHLAEAVVTWDNPKLQALAVRLEPFAPPGPRRPALRNREIWSERAMRDLRKTRTGRSTEVRDKWYALLDHALMIKGKEPSQAWRTEARKKRGAVGTAELVEMVLPWLPLAAKRNSSCSEINATVLEGLIWMLADVDDARLARAVAKLATSAYPGKRKYAKRISGVCLAALGAMPGEHGRSELERLGFGPESEAAPAFLIGQGDAAVDSDGDRIGGVPLASARSRWPKCRTCRGPMQFLAQLRLSDLGLSKPLDKGRLLIFQCQNEPGCCDEWEPDSGGNRARIVADRSAVPMSPPQGLTTLDRVEALSIVSTDDHDGQEAALGRIGGEPDWLQTDETPSCCGMSMAFLVELESTDDVNFGDTGRGYAFGCRRCRKAKFLWQSL